MTSVIVAFSLDPVLSVADKKSATEKSATTDSSLTNAIAFLSDGASVSTSVPSIANVNGTTGFAPNPLAPQSAVQFGSSAPSPSIFGQGRGEKRKRSKNNNSLRQSNGKRPRFNLDDAVEQSRSFVSSVY